MILIKSYAEIIYLKTSLEFLNLSKNLFDSIPGLLFKASIQIPESSAKQGVLNFLKPYRDFIFALAAKLSPVSFGSFILGKSFKPETNIQTGSPSILLKNILDERGVDCEIYDPYVDDANDYDW